MPPTSSFSPLPLDLSTFVGREAELAQLQDLFSRTRLLTLTGPGGSGKTRLALELAGRQAEAARVLWVELAEANDAASVNSRIAQAMGIQDEASLAALLERLPGDALVALDNCEHVVDAVAAAVEAMLLRHPALRVLATSREPLGIRGERAWLVPPLSLGHDGEGASEAVGLFVERAREVAPNFELTSANREAVEAICRALDGIPLAIELAAARVRLLSPTQIRERLHEALDLLSRGGRTAVPRHRTLRAALDWSHALLDAESAALLRRLAVFQGGTGLEGVEFVGGDEGADPLDTLEVLGRLVDRSLVAVREQDSAARYHLLETVRIYALERLDEAGESETVRARHAAFMVALVEDARPHLTGAGRRMWVERLTAELPNLRAALAWTHEHDPALHLRLTTSLWWFWFSSRHWTEARRWLEGALSLDAAATPDRGRAELLFALGALEALQGRSAPAGEWLRQALELADGLGDEQLATYARVYLGMSLAQVHDPEAEQHLRPALEWLEAAGDLYLLRLAQILMGSAYANRGEMDAALEITRAGVATARAFGQDRELGISLQALGVLHWQVGDPAAAHDIFLESLAALERDPSVMFLARSLHYLALCRARRGHGLDAVRLLATAETARAAVGVQVIPLDAAHSEAVIHELETSLGDGLFQAAWSRGRESELADVVAEVLRGEESPDVPAPVAAQASAQPAPDLRIRLLGPMDVEVEGRPVPSDAWPYARPKELLALLALHPEGRTRAQIAAAMWPESAPAQAKNSVHVTLHHLRKTLGRPDWIEVVDDRYRLAERLTIDIDVHRFEALARTHGAGLQDLRRAAELYRGDLLADDVSSRWIEEPSDRLRRLRRGVVLALGTTLEEAAEDAEAEALYRGFARREELDEEFHRRLMALWTRRGERVRALEHFRRLAELLKNELEAEPEPETLELLARIQAGAA
jgi:predicted ATPase/DNA-binding SARP family transcriptional activator